MNPLMFIGSFSFSLSWHWRRSSILYLSLSILSSVVLLPEKVKEERLKEAMPSFSSSSDPDHHHEGLPPPPDDYLASRLAMIRSLVAQPIPSPSSSSQPPSNTSTTTVFQDPHPAELGGGLLVGNKRHAANVADLTARGVVAVLNCASGGISRLPLDELEAAGIRYSFTNVRQDDETYPVLHDKNNKASDHLKVAKALYGKIQENNGNNNSNNNNNNNKVLFFCVAGQNRSAALAVAVLLLYGHDLETILQQAAPQRPFILENQGFQRQLVELEWRLQLRAKQEQQQQETIPPLPPPKPTQRPWRVSSFGNFSNRSEEDDTATPATAATTATRTVEIELLIPGLCTMDVPIPRQSTISQVKQCLVEYANKHLLSYDDPNTSTTSTLESKGNNNNNDNTNNNTIITSVAKSWMVLAMFGFDDMYDIPLELEATHHNIILERMKTMFGLQVNPQTLQVQWTAHCRFALVIFSVYKIPSHVVNHENDTTGRDEYQQKLQYQQPWFFCHQERAGAPATFLENTLMSTHLRAWDFLTGQSYTSAQPIVFSFSPDGARDKRQFMKISTSAHQAQQFHAPGEGGILGMGANAIVHRVELHPTSAEGIENSNDNNDEKNPSSSDSSQDQVWDAAVKRLFDLSKMLKFLGDSSEAGLAKRMRFANSLNSDGRVVTFYGLGVGLAANAYNPNEYKFEASLLSRYEETFSTYTMRRFIEDYVCPPDMIAEHELKNTDGDKNDIAQLQADFSILSVKVLLVSLLNAFRDLTLMGIIAFDFNHLNNVLVSRDHSSVRLIDIDGDSKGSIQYPSEYIQGATSTLPHKPSLDVDLNTVLPRLVQTLLLGKGRGPAFVTNTVSQVWRTQPEEKAKEILRTVLEENFFHGHQRPLDSKVTKHVSKVAEWFYAMLKKQSPWTNWTNDIYDAMRCIDHLPIS